MDEGLELIIKWICITLCVPLAMILLGWLLSKIKKDDE